MSRRSLIVTSTRGCLAARGAIPGRRWSPDGEPSAGRRLLLLALFGGLLQDLLSGLLGLSGLLLGGH